MDIRISINGLVSLDHKVTPPGNLTAVIAHNHPVMECIFFLRGRICFRWEELEIKPTPSSAILIPQGVIHSLEADPTETYDRFILHYYPDVLPEPFRDYLLDSLLSNIYYIERADDLLSDIMALQACFDLPDTIREEAVRARLISLLIRMTTLSKQQVTVQSYSSVIPGVLEFIHMNIQNAQDVTIDALAQRFYISKSQLGKLFYRSTGESLAKYIRIKRFEYAELLRMRGMPAVEAAAKAGFRCYSTYFRLRNSEISAKALQGALDNPVLYPAPHLPRTHKAVSSPPADQ